MSAPSISPAQITGLVLAGGRGSRMGGVDKGLQPYLGQPLAQHALQRLAPQVGPLMISANRHLADYAALGVPVWPDAQADYPGPLAGLLSGLRHCQTPYLLSVPCDSPRFPADLAARLAAALLEAQAQIAVVSLRDEAGVPRRQPVFCLMRCEGLAESLARSLAAGEHKVGQWLARHRCVEPLFEPAEDFVNMNTLDELRRLERGL